MALERANGGSTVSASLSKDKQSFSLRFVAVVNHIFDGPITIYNDARCPKLGSSYILGTEVSLGCVAQGFKWQQHGGSTDEGSSTVGRWKWTVDVEYATIDKEEKQPPGVEQAKVSYDTETYDELLAKDVNSVDVINSCQQPFDPPPVVERSRMIVRVEKSLAGFDAGFAMQCQDAVNSQPFLGFPANTLRITKISAQPQDNNGIPFYSVSVEMQHRESIGTLDLGQPHQAHILDAGRYQKGPDPTGPLRKIVDDDGDAMTDPVPLNGNGYRLTGGEPVYKHFKRYRTLDYNSLGIYP